MSDAWQCGVDVDDDTEIRTWLTAMALAPTEDAVDLLTRAVRPATFGKERAALELPAPDSMRSRAVATLIEAGQVPTFLATEGKLWVLVDKEGRNRSGAEGIPPWISMLDDFGEILAPQIFARWNFDGHGPTWSELLKSPTTREFVTSRGLEGHYDRTTRQVLMRKMMGAGWLCFSRQPRSLCAGPTAHAYQRGQLTRIWPTGVGRTVGRSVGTFRYQNHRGPTWDELAEYVIDHRGLRVFVDGSDAEAQSVWLLAEEWIRIEDGELKRGKATKRFARSKKEARIATQEGRN